MKQLFFDIGFLSKHYWSSHLKAVPFKALWFSQGYIDAMFSVILFAYILDYQFRLKWFALPFLLYHDPVSGR